MIYTLTTNPAIDMNITSGSLSLGAVTRTKDAAYSPNGKGLNVSFVLRRFGVDSCILGFFGGFSGEYILGECQKMGYAASPIEIQGTNRVNVFVETDQGEYKLVNEGPCVSREEQERFLSLLEKLDDPELLIISGSLSAGMTEDLYDEIFRICKKRQVEVVLDISSKKMGSLLQYRPLLIKPNDDELRSIFGLRIENEADAVAALKWLHKEGAQNILLTMGEKGAYFYNGQAVWFCQAYPVKLKSSACAGDGCLAAFLSVWHKDNEDVETALRLACATGADVAQSAGLGDLTDLEEYKTKITARKICEV